MSQDIVNEGSIAYLTAKFYDKDDKLDAPSSITYRIDCLTNDQEILGDTPIGSPASTVEITITATQNAIITQSNDFERRLVTVKATYGTGNAVNEEFEYYVKNLAKVT